MRFLRDKLKNTGVKRGCLAVSAMAVIYSIIVGALMVKRLYIRVKNDSFREAEFCLSNLMDVSFGVTRLIIIMVVFVTLVYLLRHLFRSNVIVKYGRRSSFLKHLYRYNFMAAIFMTVIITAVSAALSAVMSDCIHNNWNDPGSFINIRCNGMETDQLISLGEYICLFCFAVFAICFICGQVIILSWCFLSPVIGVICLLVLFGMETAMSTPLVKVLFTYVNVNSLDIFYNGVDCMELVGVPVIWILVLFIINAVVAGKKNLLGGIK